MSPPRARHALRRAVVAALLALAAAPTSATAYRGSGDFQPRQTPAVVPGTTRVVESWKLVGAGVAPSGLYTASQVQIAPRWVIGAVHSSMTEEMRFVRPDGHSSAVQQVFKPTQLAVTGLPGSSVNNRHGVVDIVLALLEEELPAPTGGFPRLLADPLTPEFASALPGDVLWAGHGAYQRGGYVPGVLHAIWTAPSGLPNVRPGFAQTQDGDSGSTGFWYPTPSARPVIASITTLPQSNRSLGENSKFSAPLVPNGSAAHATVADWMREVVRSAQAAIPGLIAPTWTALPAQGILASELPPIAPTDVRVATASSSSLTVAWDHTYESRVPRDGYELHLTPGDVRATVPPDATSHRFTGLELGETYTVSVRARNANGLSAPKTWRYVAGRPGPPDYFEPVATSYRLRPAPPRPEVTLRAFYGATMRKACVEVTVRVPAGYAAGAGETIRPDVRLDGVALPASAFTETDGDFVATRCDLPHDTEISALARLLSDATPGPWQIDGLTTPPFLGITAITANARRAATADGAVDYCVDVSWPRPVAHADYPHVGTTLFADTEPYEYEHEYAPEVTDATICGLDPGRRYRFGVLVRRTGLRPPPPPPAEVTTPQGAPTGTPLAAPTIGAPTQRKAADGTYCLGVSWNAPETVAGFPVGGYSLAAYRGAAVYPSVSGASLAADRRSDEICGLPPRTMVVVRVSAEYPLTAQDGAQLDAWRSVTTGP